MRPESLEVWLELGQTLANDLQRAGEALVVFRCALERAPDDAHLHFRVGHALTVLGRHEEAVESYRRSIALDPNFAIAHCDLGISLDALGRTREAVDSFERSIALDPSAALAHYNLGVSQIALGRIEEGIASYRRALERDPKLTQLNVNIGNALGRLKRFDEALECYRRALEVDPKNAEAHYYSAWTLNRLARDREAIDELLLALQLRPQEAPWHRFLAWLLATTEHAELRDPAGAVAHARRALELAPTNGDIAGVLGVASYVAGDFNAARDSLLQAIDLAGDNEVRSLFLSLCESHLGEAESARDYFERVAPSLDELLTLFPALQRFVDEARAAAAKGG